MKQEDQDRADSLNAIADLCAKNIFAYAVILVFVGVSVKLIWYTNNWQEMTSMAAFDAIIMWVLKYYFPKK
jgi:hypothetical protein